jgi:hypothetical protein
LVGWRLYARARRSFGRQALAPTRLRVSLGLLPLVLVALGYGALAQGASLDGMVPGVLAGLGLGWCGLRSTRFEQADGAHYYYPNPWLGLALVLLVAGRMGYRLLFADMTAGPPPLTFWTLVSISMLLTYYWTMAFGLLRWRTATRA